MPPKKNDVELLGEAVINAMMEEQRQDEIKQYTIQDTEHIVFLLEEYKNKFSKEEQQELQEILDNSLTDGVKVGEFEKSRDKIFDIATKEKFPTINEPNFAKDLADAYEAGFVPYYNAKDAKAKSLKGYDEKIGKTNATWEDVLETSLHKETHKYLLSQGKNTYYFINKELEAREKEKSLREKSLADKVKSFKQKTSKIKAKSTTKERRQIGNTTKEIS